jgi:hypothetical protein
MFFEELHGLADDIAAATRASRRAARFDALHPIIALIDEI